ncbi:MAG TPA: DUF3034 family protein [Phycisphaerae bacterium]|nr:DUF3034 family protein [Phycisphaerae bacterium]
MKSNLAWVLVGLLLVSPAVLAEENADSWDHTVAAVNVDTTASGAPVGSWLAATAQAAAEADVKAADEAKAAAAAGDGPPLPLHTIEGVGGALAVPMAYLVNPGPKGTVVGKPSASLTYLQLGNKSLQVFAVTETLYRRIELGYAYNRFCLGNFPHVVRKASGGALRIRRQEVSLHHFNARALLVEENTKFLGIPMPAIVAGIQVKVNGGIMGINDSLSTPGGQVLTNIGLEKSNGIDYVLTASKTFPELLFGRPLILTAGVRNSKASNFGYLGFGQACHTTVECDVATLVTDWLAVGYEFRQRTDPYDKARPLHLGEENFHAIRLGVILSPNCTIAAGWAYLGQVGNSDVDCAWGVQIKYEF